MSDSHEQDRGQRVVTPLDIAEIASLLDANVTIRAGGKTRARGLPVILFRAVRGNETWNILFEHRRRRRMLALRTIYISVRR